MIRTTLILMLLCGPAFAQTVPVPRPEGLVECSIDAADRAVEVAAAVAQAVLTEATVADAAEPASTGRAAIAAQITGAIRDCWNVGDLSDEVMAISIWVAFNATPEGEVIRDTIEMTGFSGGTKDAADEALGPAFRAIMRCAETGLDLPVETYPVWQRVEVQFDASGMVAR